MILRRLTIKDAAMAAAFEQNIFADPWSERSFEETLADENAYYVGMFTEKGNLAALCGMRIIIDEGDISNVAADPAYRRQGLAEALLRDCMAYGDSHGCVGYTLEVRVSNEPAIALYTKLGFAEEGRRKNFYQHPTEDAGIYWCRKNQ